MRSKKAGFTIVELVIVIAVIAALAAVLIPVFTSLLPRARQAANDERLCVWNEQLALCEILAERPALPSQALAAMELSPETLLALNDDGRQLFWDSHTNRFALYEPSEISAASSSLWQFVDELPVQQNCNYYLLPGSYPDTITVSAGIDTGENENISIICTGESPGDLSVATTGGTVTVNMTCDTLYHYGNADAVSLRLGDGAYCEYGAVRGNILCYGGTVVLAEGADAAAVIVMENDTAVLTNGQNIPVRTASDRGIDPASVSGADGETDAVCAQLFAGGLGIAESPYLVLSSEQFHHISICPDACFRQIGTFAVDRSVASFRGTYDGGGCLLTTSSPEGIFASLNGATVKNLALQAEISAAGNAAALASHAADVMLSDISLSGYISSDHPTLVGGLIASADQAVSITLLRCTSSAAITCASPAAPAQSVLAAGLIASADNVSALNLSDCANTGDIAAYASDSSALGGLLGKAENTSLHMTRPVSEGSLLLCASFGACYVGGLVGQFGQNCTASISSARSAATCRATAASDASPALVLGAGGITGYLENKNSVSLTVADSIISAQIAAEGNADNSHCHAVIGHLPSARRGDSAYISLSNNSYPPNLLPYKT